VEEPLRLRLLVWGGLDLGKPHDETERVRLRFSNATRNIVGKRVAQCVLDQLDLVLATESHAFFECVLGKGSVHLSPPF
jgi:hypothetical protein